MMTAIGAEIARVYHIGAGWITLALAILGAAVFMLPGHVSPFEGTTALVWHRGFSQLNFKLYADMLDVVIPWGVAILALLGEIELLNSERSLLVTWPLKTPVWAVARVTAVLGWGLVWIIMDVGIPALFGDLVPFVRDVLLVFPVALFLSGIAITVSECFHDLRPGVVALTIVSLLGFGIRGLPVQNAMAINLEVFDARNHPMVPGLVHNVEWLLALGLAALVAGCVAWDIYRRRGVNDE